MSNTQFLDIDQIGLVQDIPEELTRLKQKNTDLAAANAKLKHSRDFFRGVVVISAVVLGLYWIGQAFKPQPLKTTENENE